MKRHASVILDELLVLRSRRGDQQALGLLFKKWHKPMVRQAYLLTGRQDVAKDIVQDCWMAIIKGIGRLRDPGSFRTWVFRIVRGKCVDWVRAVQRGRKHEEAITIEEQFKNEPTSFEEDSQNAVNLVRKAMDGIDGEQKYLLTLSICRKTHLRNSVKYLRYPLVP